MAHYNGSCHCGAVSYSVELELGKVIACNCSICAKSGTLLAFVAEDKFELKTGEDALTPYTFNKHVILHNFCKTCGIKSFSRGKKPDGTPMVAINARCLDGIDVFTLDVQQFDGKSR
ncbi:MAG TPA: GFA family protein [Kofleriaceae bacterium]|nr:GFA family protein [Kofleriaceae bacterium]